VLFRSDGIDVGADGFVKLAYLDGTRVELERNTQLRVTLGEGEDRDAKRLALDMGKMACEAVKQPKAMEIEARHATARVVGTRFTLDVTDPKTALSVVDGKVECEREGQSILVGPGQSAEASEQGLKMLPPAASRALAAKVLRKFNVPLEAGILTSVGSIAFDGKVLWACNGCNNANVLWKLNPMTGAAIGKLVVGNCLWMKGLAWDGKYFWLCAVMSGTSRYTISALDPETGRLVKSLNGPEDMEAVYGLAFGDGYLWMLGSRIGQLQRVAKLELSSGAVVASWELPKVVALAHGLEYLDGALWLAGEGGRKVFKLNPADGTVLGSFATPSDGRSVHGLAKSGTAGQMWMFDHVGWVYLVEVGE